MVTVCVLPKLPGAGLKTGVAVVGPTRYTPVLTALGDAYPGTTAMALIVIDPGTGIYDTFP
jgi:hypothetical protein